MIKTRSHKIRLKPTVSQEKKFRCCCGVSRFAYNWGLARWNEQYKNGGKPNEAALRKELNYLKRDEFPWMLDSSKAVVQQAIKNLGRAFVNFFEKRAKYPKFKKKHNISRQSARMDNGPGTFEFSGKKVKLPKLGWVSMFEEFRWPEGRPMSAVLKREGERWFLSVSAEVDIPNKENSENQAIQCVGIDLGLTSALTLSTGEKIISPKPLKANLKKLARLQRRFSKSVKGSSNREKRRKKLSRAHWRVMQIRRDWQHKVTSDISKRFKVVCMEDLNVKGMLKNHCLARSISDIGWGELKRQLSYKSYVLEVGRFFPSSKTCSDCGAAADHLPLSVREWSCSACGSVHDRDINAAKNILAQALSTVSCTGIDAFGDGGSGCKGDLTVKLSSMNKE